MASAQTALTAARSVNDRSASVPDIEIPGPETAGASSEPVQSADAFSVRLDQFEGPLDLLLNLIRRQKISISDIPIASITEQYIDYLRRAAGEAAQRELFILAGGHDGAASSALDFSSISGIIIGFFTLQGEQDSG